MNNLERVREFMEAMGQGLNLPFSSELLTLRMNLIDEETDEVGGHVDNYPMVILDAPELTKELADLLYVTYGFALTFGLPLQEVFEEVHKSNMSKLGDDGKPIYREDGKVLKGPNYQPPKLEKYFE